MPAKRQYHVKGTKDFIVLAGIFFFLCLWAVKDAWFPSPKVMKKHPQEIVVAFEVAGTVERVNVDVGDSVTEEMVLANLRSDRIAVEFDEAKGAYTEAKKKHAMLRATSDASDAGAIQAAKEAMEQSLAKVEELRVALDSTELLSPSKGEIMEKYIATHSLVEAGDQAFLIDPKDHFYLFNKSLAIFSFFLFWVFLAIHTLAR